MKPPPTTLADYSFGQHFEPGPILTSIKDLDQKNVRSEQVVRVLGARVVYANYPLLQHDFPQLQDKALLETFPVLKKLEPRKRQKAIRQKIEEWLIQNSAFISERQARQTVVNKAIRTGNVKVKAFRPPAYGRALVFSLEENETGLSQNGVDFIPKAQNGLLDVKGTGVAPNKKPTDEAHSNGLYRLGYALVELTLHELFSRILKHSKSQFKTLPIYGILDLGFTNKTRWTKNGPTAMMIRRAHRRAENPGGLYKYGSDGQQVQLAAEQLFRKYGITSVNDVTTIKIWREDGQLKINYGEQAIDFFTKEQLAEIERVSHHKEGMGPIYYEGINVEHTREISLNPPSATLIDFESYYAKESFENPVLSLVSDKLLRWGGTIWPHYENFVHPDPKLQIPYHLLSAPGKIWGYSFEKDWPKLYSLCYSMADDFSKNRLNRQMVLQTLLVYLEALTAHLEEY